MGLIRMSTRDLKRIEVLSEVLVGRHTVTEAGSLLGLSERQMYRLLARYQQEGGSGIAHKSRGRESNRSYNPRMSEGMWLSRKQRKRFHQPRLRRERCGELASSVGESHSPTGYHVFLQALQPQEWDRSSDRWK